MQKPVNQAPHQDHLPQIEGIALDMDGLLFDTEALYWQVGETVLGRRGHRFARILQQRMMGRVGAAALQQMVDHHGLSDSAELLLAESDEIYSELLQSGVPPMPGLDTLIDVLRACGLPFGVATSSQRKFAERILGATLWYDELHFVLTGDDVIHGKPHPEMYERAAKKLGVDPSKMLVLEDSGNGSAAGVAAKAIVVSIPNESTHDHSFEGVYGIAKSLDDPLILRLLKQQA